MDGKLDETYGPCFVKFVMLMHALLVADGCRTVARAAGEDELNEAARPWHTHTTTTAYTYTKVFI